MLELNVNEYAPYYKSYIALLSGEPSVIGQLRRSYDEAEGLLKKLPMEKQEYSYAEGKWTIKEMLQHLIDTERIFAFRALHIARHDVHALPGFDEADYVIHSDGNGRDYQDLLEEFETVRKASLYLFKSLTEEALLRTGLVNNGSVSVRAIGYLISGHQMHHLNVIRERYL